MANVLNTRTDQLQPDPPSHGRSEAQAMSQSAESVVVFLSYSRADSQIVAHLKADLQRHGIEAWIDQEGIQPGTPDWEVVVRQALRSAQTVLLLASPQARSSRYVKDELRIAEMYCRPICPVWIAGSQWMEAIPLGWGEMQYIDARGPAYEAAVQTIIKTVTAAAGRTTAVRPSATSPPAPPLRAPQPL